MLLKVGRCHDELSMTQSWADDVSFDADQQGSL
jgi:hypothetical protein